MEAGTIGEISLPASGWAHRHTFYEIVYVDAGVGTHIIDFEAFPVRPATLYFLRPGQVHLWNYRSQPTGYLLVFTEEFLLTRPSREDLSRDVALFTALADVAELQLDAAQASWFVMTLKDIVREYQGAEDDHKSVLQAYVHVLLARAGRLVSSACPRQHISRSSLLVRQFNDLVTHRVQVEQSVRAFSDQLGVTPSHLADIVKGLTGRTPSEIIRGARIVEAKRLLEYTEKTVAQIAYDLGFKDTAYFGRFFKRESGVTPGEFRRTLVKESVTVDA